METMPLEIEFLVQVLSEQLTLVIDNEAEKALYAWVLKHAMDPNSTGQAVLNSALSLLKDEHPKLFDWVMYHLNYAKGFEEVVASFWVTNYMMTKEP
jgi:hypothetical protein